MSKRKFKFRSLLRRKKVAGDNLQNLLKSNTLDFSNDEYRKIYKRYASLSKKTIIEMEKRKRFPHVKDRDYYGL